MCVFYQIITDQHSEFSILVSVLLVFIMNSGIFSTSKKKTLTSARILTSQFIKVIYYQLKHGLQKDNRDTSGASALLDDSWLSSDSFLYHLCKVGLTILSHYLNARLQCHSE